jgi:hypothetical protein
VLGYGRVSREGQDLAQQRAALRAAGCTRLFEEKASGGRWDRPELHRLLDHLRPGDVVVVWKLDRLSRSLKDLLHIMEKIGEAGAGFRSLTEHVDTTTLSAALGFLNHVPGDIGSEPHLHVRLAVPRRLSQSSAKSRRQCCCGPHMTILWQTRLKDDANGLRR